MRQKNLDQKVWFDTEESGRAINRWTTTHRMILYTTNPLKRSINTRWDPYLPRKDRIATIQG